MQNNQYNPQYYHQSSQSPAHSRSNGVWIILGVLTATILLSAIVALVLILILNGPNKNLDYPKAAVVTNPPSVATTVPTTANIVSTPAFSTPTQMTAPASSPVIGGTVSASAADYELPVSPLAGRVILNQKDDQHILDGMPKFGFKNGRYEMYKVDLTKDISAGRKVRDFYYAELPKLGWNYNEKRSNDTDNIYIFEKGNLNTFVIPFLVGYDLSDNIYSYAGVKSGDAIILVMTGEYEQPKPTPTAVVQNPTPTTAPYRPSK